MYTYQHTPTINAQIGAETGAKNRLSCTLERYIRHQFSILVTITHTLTAMKWNRPPGPVLHRRLKTKKDIKIADAGLKLVRILILLAFILSKEWVRMELSSPSLPTIPDHHHHHLVISKYHTTSHTAFKTIQRDWCSSSATTIGTIAIRAVWYCYTRSKAPFKYCPSSLQHQQEITSPTVSRTLVSVQTQPHSAVLKRPPSVSSVYKTPLPQVFMEHKQVVIGGR